MYGELIILAHKVRSAHEEHCFVIRWKGTLSKDSVTVTIQSGDSAPNIPALSDALINAFGSNLKDLNNEIHVEIQTIASSQTVGGRNLATKRYLTLVPLSEKEQMQLTDILEEYQPNYLTENLQYSSRLEPTGKLLIPVRDEQGNMAGQQG